MNVIFDGYLEMRKGWYNSGKERKEGIEQMESEGWILYDESLIDNTVIVTFVREPEIEDE